MTRHSAAVGSGSSLVIGSLTKATPGSAAMASVTACSVAGVGARGHLGGEDERAVEARPEAVGEQVVGLAGGGVLGVVALVGEAEAQPEDRQRQHDQERRADEHRRPRAVLDDPAPAVRERLAQRPALPSAPACAAGRRRSRPAARRPRAARLITSRAGIPSPTPTRAMAMRPAAMRPRHRVTSIAFAGEPEQGGQQGERGDHRHRHDDGLPIARPVTKLSRIISMPEQRDDDRRAGEQHGAPGGVDRDQRRLLDAVALVQVLAEPGDDEQGVVDADAEADHDRDRRREVGHATKLRSSPTIIVPTPMPARATPIGRPIASTEPKAMIRMMIAKPSRAPPTTAARTRRRPARRARSRTPSTSGIALGSRRRSRPSPRTTRPRGLDLGVGDPPGVVARGRDLRLVARVVRARTTARPSISATSAKNGSIACRTSGSSTPRRLAKTMLPICPRPDRRSGRRGCRSRACSRRRAA